MSLVDKLISGVLITLLLTFGGVVYKSQTDRIGVLEATAATVQAQAVRDQVTLAEIKLELKYTRLSVERMEAALNALLLSPPRSLPLSPPARLFIPPTSPLQGP